MGDQDLTNMALGSLSTLTQKEISRLKLTRPQLISFLSEAITERNKFQAVLQSIDNGVFAVDWDGKIMLFNKAAQKITGLKEKEVIDHYCEEVLNTVSDKGFTQSADIPLAEAFSLRKTIEIPFIYLKSSHRRKIPVSLTYSSVKGLKDALVLGICSPEFFA